MQVQQADWLVGVEGDVGDEGEVDEPVEVEAGTESESERVLLDLLDAD